MSPERTIKHVLPRQIEGALAKALTELLGREYAVSIGNMDFARPAALVGRVPIEIKVGPVDRPVDPVMTYRRFNGKGSHT